MQEIIDRLNAERAELEQQIDANDHELVTLHDRRKKLITANDQAEEVIDGINAAVSVLAGKAKRGLRRRK